jgi:hypothetical protein
MLAMFQISKASDYKLKGLEACSILRRRFIVSADCFFLLHCQNLTMQISFPGFLPPPHGPSGGTKYDNDFSVNVKEIEGLVDIPDFWEDQKKET